MSGRYTMALAAPVTKPVSARHTCARSLDGRYINVTVAESVAFQPLAMYPEFLGRPPGLAGMKQDAAWRTP